MRRRWFIWGVLPCVLLLGVGAYLMTGGKLPSLRTTPPPSAGRQLAPPRPFTPADATLPDAISAGVVAPGEPATMIFNATPQWAPNGRSIAYVRHNDSDHRQRNGDLYLAEFLSGKWVHRWLADGADSPCWSPDGRTLACNQKGLALMTLSSRKIRQVVADDLSDGESYRYHYPVCWSPDGRYLFYRVGCWEWGDSGVYDSTTGKTIDLKLGDAQGMWMSAHQLLLWVNPDEPAEELDGDLVQYDLTTRQKKTLASKGMLVPLAVSADSKTAYLDTGKAIAQLNLATGTVKSVMTLTTRYPAWSPDGTRFAFLDEHWHNGKHERKPFSLYVGSITDGKTRVLATPVVSSADEFRQMHGFAWSADGTWIAYTTGNGDIAIIKP